MTTGVTSVLSPATAAPAEPFVLVVDDHEPSLRTLRALVEAAGHACVAMPSAPDALVYCDARRPALVVTDLAMPRMDGQGLARWLKARYPTTPILLVTGELLDTASLSALRRTFADVLSKPLQVEGFLRLLDDLMPAAGPPPRA
jgi:CheY-like chemotaxis protein